MGSEESIFPVSLTFAPAELLEVVVEHCGEAVDQLRPQERLFDVLHRES